MINKTLKNRSLRIITETPTADGKTSKRIKDYGDITSEADNQSIFSVCQLITGLQSTTPVDYQMVTVESLTETAA